MKRILVHDYAGHPFEVQLSRSLAQRGHIVLHLYAGHNQTPRGSLQKTGLDPDRFYIRPLYIREPLQKYNFVKRWRQEVEYGYLLAQEIEAFKPDAVISANTPLDPQVQAVASTRRVKARFIFWLQDVISLATKRLLRRKLGPLGTLIGQYYIAKEKLAARNSDAIVPITEDFLPILKSWGIKQSSIKTIPNWAPLEEIPVRKKLNSWSNKFGLSDKTVFLYSGTLGMKHNPRLLLQLALALKVCPGTMLVIISEGPGAEWLYHKKAKHNLNNMTLLGYQPMADFADVLASGDVLVAILEAEAGIYSVPSKVLSYLCAQRPLLLAVPKENLTAKIVTQHRAGLVSDPDQSDEFIQNASMLLNNQNLREEFSNNARCYAEIHFDIERITDQFESLL